MSDSLLSTLKPRQLKSIKHTQAPQLILAGAGTGKTTTITARIAYMVEKENIDPSHIIALTFSKEAARNMREKVEKLLKGKEVIVKTFHSFWRIEIMEKKQPQPQEENNFDWTGTAEEADREWAEQLKQERLHPELIEGREKGMPDFLVEIEREKRALYYQLKKEEEGKPV